MANIRVHGDGEEHAARDAGVEAVGKALKGLLVGDIIAS
jgi:hypothetical protein